MSTLIPVDHDPFDMAGTLRHFVHDPIPQPFSDVPNWRGRVLADQVAPGRFPGAPIDPKWQQLPLSENIDDRRREPDWRRMFVDWMGTSPEQAMKMIKNPMTPLRVVDPAPVFPTEERGRLSIDAGLLDIGEPWMGRGVTMGAQEPDRAANLMRAMGQASTSVQSRLIPVDHDPFAQ